MYNTLDPVTVGHLEYHACTFYVGGVDVFGCIQRQGGCRMHHDVYTLHRSLDILFITDVTLDDGDLLLHIRVIEVGYVQGHDIIAPIVEVSNKVDAEETSPACNKYFHVVCCNAPLLCCD